LSAVKFPYNIEEILISVRSIIVAINYYFNPRKCVKFCLKHRKAFAPAGHDWSANDNKVDDRKVNHVEMDVDLNLMKRLLESEPVIDSDSQLYQEILGIIERNIAIFEPKDFTVCRPVSMSFGLDLFNRNIRHHFMDVSLNAGVPRKYIRHYLRSFFGKIASPIPVVAA
jgi:hypothetical protein